MGVADGPAGGRPKPGDGTPCSSLQHTSPRAPPINHNHTTATVASTPTCLPHKQISIIYQLPRLFVGSFTLVLPYFPTGTGEPPRPCGRSTSAAGSALLPPAAGCAGAGPSSRQGH